MIVIRESSLSEYAAQFWAHQQSKGSAVPVEVASGGDQIQWLAQLYRDKIPYGGAFPLNVQVVELSPGEVAGLRVHDRLVDDDWMRERNLVVHPRTTVIGELAAHFARQSWPHDCGQRKYYDVWKSRGSLADVFTNDMPMIEVTDGGEHEIVDGWGRFLALAALLAEGFGYAPVRSFLASKDPGPCTHGGIMPIREGQPFDASH